MYQMLYYQLTSFLPIHLQNLLELLLTVLEHSGCHNMHLLPLQYIYQGHLFLDGVEEFLNLSFVFLSIPFRCLSFVCLVHDFKFEIVESLGVVVNFYLLFGEELFDFVFVGFGGGDIGLHCFDIPLEEGDGLLQFVDFSFAGINFLIIVLNLHEILFLLGSILLFRTVQFLNFIFCLFQLLIVFYYL